MNYEGLPPQRDMPPWVVEVIDAEQAFKTGELDFEPMCELIRDRLSHSWDEPTSKANLTIGDAWEDRFVELARNMGLGRYENTHATKDRMVSEAHRERFLATCDKLRSNRSRPAPALPQGVVRAGDVSGPF